MKLLQKSHKLDNVCYDIRGKIHQEALRMEEEGQRILKLNIGNTAPFGFEAPEEVVRDVIRNIPNSQGYCESNGIFSARKAIAQYYQQKGLKSVDADDIFIGNGASELITMTMNALLNNGDEVLVPAPDYPLWTAAINLAGGKAVHYMCDEQSNWYPDLEDMKKKLSSRTVGIVLINPNNPTGAVYPTPVLQEIVEFARQNDLVIFADEIYDKILYDDVAHRSICTLADDVTIVTFNGLSKVYRACGFRMGWIMITGPEKRNKGFLDGIKIMMAMRLCANVPLQHAIQTALGGYQSINELIIPGGRLYQQRAAMYERLNSIDGITVVKPHGALYMFPKLDKKFNIKDDQKFAMDLLRQEKMLIVQGTGFNWPEPNHFRMVFLPSIDIINDACDRLEHFLKTYRQ
ncbi:pyridoxal phosphate-dependent aminotransferase [Succinivibrio dextrinosolvens]|jgi:alanine-synthesizing transaminase|uniref:alanine transaminase n=1 Tax=Succinivibrio dextrinosolvens DSM 3072 TaxID=1123324 RepID=A0A1T4VE49_9GAMM|nr:pyridoxal phosphate-dependent aminotransferase [Succinivibrio dextrinosolvens]MBE6422129.1 pyridoxal phosphate-dependent aminotransferase [Succinivibrio dextrinosolvens]MBQ3678517.1 pyridoxal phosphate-dependent aminotransferase [Succinivibrio sp.]SKA63207.1 alanine-synthesizing transaminase [Succinivibrio dextrinosolvens DSM 3072]